MESASLRQAWRHGNVNPFGQLGVAAAAGLCQTNLRLASKLAVPLPTPYIILAGVRDADPKGGLSVKAAYELIRGALRGVQQRSR
ncbi:MAG: hypothetical protein IMZ46_08010 [Acidobacteria bacterium]|nr:hypothetical protein [Acidobacteriota bacterium]